MEKQSRSAAADKPAIVDKPANANPGMARTIRETVESIVIAFVLAFLFRTFEAEAFVIPTGSMAPTLQGRHKDVECPECGYPYKVGAQGEREDRNPDLRMDSAICPMCRHELDLDRLIPADPRTYQTFEGDRILVNKFAYDTAEPKRWDIVVFKYPEDAKTNYIKRLVGLPGEHVYIGDPGQDFRLPRDQHNEVMYTGDIYVSTDGGKTRHIARKETPAKLVAMLQDVYDSDYVPKSLADGKWPARWRGAGRQPGWTADDEARAFTFNGTEPSWLRYHHYVPAHGSWSDASGVQFFESAVTDFYPYNTGDYGGRDRQSPPKWVGDLALEADVEIRSGEGQVVLELVKGGRKFQAQIDLASGDAQLAIPGHESFAPKAQAVIDGPGTYRLRFANVDEQLWLFVDDELVSFDAETTYESLNNYQPIFRTQDSPDGATDLSPAAIAAAGADVTVSHLRIKRDVFYTQGDQDDARNDIALEDKENDEEDQFFMLGDNSPASKDGRLWGDVDYVERRLLIGQAVYIYWPHGVPASFSFPIKVFGSKKYVPFWPNFGRMHRVR